MSDRVRNSMPADVRFLDGEFVFIDENGQPRIGDGHPIVVADADHLAMIVDALVTRREELLATVRKLGHSIPYADEAGAAGILIAEVGTLKARVSELEIERADLISNHREQLDELERYREATLGRISDALGMEEDDDEASIIAEISKLSGQRDHATDKLIDQDRNAEILAKVNAAINRGGIHCAVEFHEAIDTIVDERNKLRAASRLDAAELDAFRAALLEPRRVVVFALYRGAAAFEPPQLGDLVKIELPANCSLLGHPGRSPAEMLRIFDMAHQVAEHWRDQEGVNGVLLDQLADATKP